MVLDTEIHCKNLELNPQTKDYIQRKFQRLQHHIKRISDAKIELTRIASRSQFDRISAQMTMSSSGRTLRGQEAGLNVFAAVDAVTDVMDRQIGRLKSKVYRTSRARKLRRPEASQEGAQPVEVATEDPAESGLLAQDGRVVRTKRFPMKPMSVKDALLDMELLSHDFFLFFNLDTSEYNVAYRRHDGDYGVIEPEPA